MVNWTWFRFLGVGVPRTVPPAVDMVVLRRGRSWLAKQRTVIRECEPVAVLFERPRWCGGRPWLLWMLAINTSGIRARESAACDPVTGTTFNATQILR